MREHLGRRVAVALSACALLAPAHAAAHPGEARLHQEPANPLNDLYALGQGGGQTITPRLRVLREEPPSVATPRADCDADSHTEPSIQGRVPEGSNPNGLDCNLELLAHRGRSGGFRVHRYVDEQGRECAFYDTTLLFPSNAFRLSGESLGIAVVDMSNPARPVQTDTLTTIPMLSPHESLSVNPKRGLIAAVMGNPAQAPGLVSIFDASKDCRHPVHRATSLLVRWGHEGAFSPDGKTFYPTSAGAQSLAAVDVTDPARPRTLWLGRSFVHGLTLSGDGNRAYVADPDNGDFAIFDTSEIQARKPNPKVHELSRLTWRSSSVPQNAIPFTSRGRPYVLEIDEYDQSVVFGDENRVGAARIIDISDERAPRVISNLRLQVHQPADHAEARFDPGATNPSQGYAAHYCNVAPGPDPAVVACSMIASGLRVFDISDVTRPQEIAYHVPRAEPAPENFGSPSAYAMSQPAIVPDRREVWYTDGGRGLFVLRVDAHAWPKPASSCKSRRRFTANVRLARGARVRSVRATLAGNRVRTVRRGRTVRVTVDLRGQTRRTVRLVVRVRLRNGRTVTTRRTYRPCARRAG